MNPWMVVAGDFTTLGGMDVAIFANGKILTLYTFIEPPAAADA